MKKIKLLCLILCTSLVEVPFVLNSNAEMISTGEVVSNLVRDQNRTRVVQFMQRQDVRAQIVKYGVDPNEASSRVASMTDAEIQKIATEIDKVPAGADDTVYIGLGLGTVLIVLLILLVLRKI